MTRITCPWCGTHYNTFQSNCTNCGGPLPFPNSGTSAQSDENLATPPPAPRTISDRYVWRLMMADGASVVAFILTLIGAIFTFIGLILSLAIVTVPVGIPFAIIGLLMLVAGVSLGTVRYRSAQQTVRVLREGQAAVGEIVEARENLSVTVNGRHPWVVGYCFDLNGREYRGKVSTLEQPGPRLQAGRVATILYLPDAPERNVLYPHP